MQPAPPNTTGNSPLQMAHAVLTANAANPWVLPNVAPDNVAPGAVNGAGQSIDYRAPNGGYSQTTDLTQTYANDYAYAYAIHDDFTLTDPTTNMQRPATTAELASMPYASSAVWSAVQTELTTVPQSVGVYSSGIYNLTPGRYSVDIYSPGSGTTTYKNNVATAHPNVMRAFVRVSWYKTVNTDGTLNQTNINNPQYSRIYEINLQQSG